MSSPRWFRRRRVGLGWRPASWQGWAVTLLAVGALVVVVASLRGSSARAPLAILVVAVYSIVALATGGSKAAPVAPRDEPPGDAEPEAAAGTEGRLRALPFSRPVPPSDEPVLVVDRLTKRFGDRLAVDDVSFSVAAGEVFGFLGPNGA